MIKNELPKGFLANGIHCGIKKKRKDLALIFSETDLRVAGVFTQNKAKAAPVILDQKKLRENDIFKAVVINSGNANCMTGKKGMKDAEKMAEETARLLGTTGEKVLVSSTGIIGELMPMRPLIKGLPLLVKGLNREGLMDAAEGIMTTDRYVKISSRVFKIGGKDVTITGMVKGAGMIHPDMATMLCYIMTDADITGQALKKALHEVNNVSFNAITVDGDMSTNDTVLLMANAQAGNPVIHEKDKSFDLFKANLEQVSVDLAKMVVEDGEGATKFIKVMVTGARNDEDARKIASSIGSSVLVKCAVQGGDPNWGRIASSAGASGADMVPEKLEIKLDGVLFFSKGRAASHIDRKKSKVFKDKEVLIELNAGLGAGKAVLYSCDISKRYITLNSYYTT